MSSGIKPLHLSILTARHKDLTISIAGLLGKMIEEEEDYEDVEEEEVEVEMKEGVMIIVPEDLHIPAVIDDVTDDLLADLVWIIIVVHHPLSGETLVHLDMMTIKIMIDLSVPYHLWVLSIGMMSGMIETTHQEEIVSLGVCLHKDFMRILVEALGLAPEKDLMNLSFAQDQDQWDADFPGNDPFQEIDSDWMTLVAGRWKYILAVQTCHQEEVIEISVLLTEILEVVEDVVTLLLTNSFHQKEILGDLVPTCRNGELPLLTSLGDHPLLISTEGDHHLLTLVGDHLPALQGGHLLLILQGDHHIFQEDHHLQDYLVLEPHLLLLLAVATETGDLHIEDLQIGDQEIGDLLTEGVLIISHHGELDLLDLTKELKETGRRARMQENLQKEREITQKEEEEVLNLIHGKILMW